MNISTLPTGSPDQSLLHYEEGRRELYKIYAEDQHRLKGIIGSAFSNPFAVFLIKAKNPDGQVYDFEAHSWKEITDEEATVKADLDKASRDFLVHKVNELAKAFVEGTEQSEELIKEYLLHKLGVGHHKSTADFIENSEIGRGQVQKKLVSTLTKIHEGDFKEKGTEKPIEVAEEISLVQNHSSTPPLLQLGTEPPPEDDYESFSYSEEDSTSEKSSTSEPRPSILEDKTSDSEVDQKEKSSDFQTAPLIPPHENKSQEVDDESFEESIGSLFEEDKVQNEDFESFPPPPSPTPVLGSITEDLNTLGLAINEAETELKLPNNGLGLPVDETGGLIEDELHAEDENLTPPVSHKSDHQPEQTLEDPNISSLQIEKSEQTHEPLEETVISSNPSMDEAETAEQQPVKKRSAIVRFFARIGNGIENFFVSIYRFFKKLFS